MGSGGTHAEVGPASRAGLWPWCPHRGSAVNPGKRPGEGTGATRKGAAVRFAVSRGTQLDIRSIQVPLGSQHLLDPDFSVTTTPLILQSPRRSVLLATLL